MRKFGFGFLNLLLFWAVSAHGFLIEDLVDLQKGELKMAFLDWKIEGPEPIVLKRYYLGKNWHLHLPYLAVQKLDEGIIRLSDGKFLLVFGFPRIKDQKPEEGRWWQSFKKQKELREALKKHEEAMKLFYSLDLIGKTPLEGAEAFQERGYAGRVDGKKENLELLSPDGARRFYKAVLKEQSLEAGGLLADEVSYLLEKELLPNGHLVRYSYDDKKRLILIETATLDGKNVFAWARFQYASPYLFETDFTVTCSDGQKLEYRLEKNKKKVFLKQFAAFSKEESYVYFSEKNQQLLKEALFQKKTLAFEYYPFKSGADFKLKNIFLKTSSGWKPLYQIAYHRDYTEVQDSGGLKSLYYYTASGRISRIERFSSEGKLSHTDCCNVSKDGRFIYQFRKNARNQSFFARSFKYDERGRLIEKSALGDLSGARPEALIFDREGCVVEKGLEKWTERFFYNEDNLLEAEEAGLLRTEYSYGPFQRLERKLVLDAGAVKKRFFYSYSPDGLLTEEIQDDGSGFLKEDLKGVSQRKIRRLDLKTGQPFYGRVEKESELFWDLAKS
ncbi:MAG: hypothetical protein WC371_02865, partial [Parachlamydiales bacterium]